MAAYEQPLFNISLVASKDLTSYQFEAVRLTTANKVTNITSATNPIVGVLQNKPTSGAEANIMVIGISKVKTGAGLDNGAKIKVNAAATTVAGRFVTGTTNADSNYRAASLGASSSSGCIVPALINFSG